MTARPLAGLSVSGVELHSLHSLVNVLLDVADGCLKEVVGEATECARGRQLLANLRDCRVFRIAPSEALVAKLGPRTRAQNRLCPCSIPVLREGRSQCAMLRCAPSLLLRLGESNSLCFPAASLLRAFTDGLAMWSAG